MEKQSQWEVIHVHPKLSSEEQLQLKLRLSRLIQELLENGKQD